MKRFSCFVVFVCLFLFGSATVSQAQWDSTYTIKSNIKLGTNYLSGDGDDEGIYVDSDGNVGIGTNTLVSALGVEGDIRASDRVYADYVLASDRYYLNGLLIAVASGTRLQLCSAANWQEIAFYSNGSVNMLLDELGNLGIGTEEPDTKLEVSGIIKTTPMSSATCDADSEGGLYYDSDDSHFYGCNGSSWVQLDN